MKGLVNLRISGTHSGESCVVLCCYVECVNLEKLVAN